jgi:hypothetical protein
LSGIQKYIIIHKVYDVNTLIGTLNDLIIDKGKFIFEHQSENIRDDYIIGKVLGSGKLY